MFSIPASQVSWTNLTSHAISLTVRQIQVSEKFLAFILVLISFCQCMAWEIEWVTINVSYEETEFLTNMFPCKTKL